MRTHLLPIYITVTAVGLSESAQPCTDHSWSDLEDKMYKSRQHVSHVASFPGVRIRGGSVRMRSSRISNN